MQAGPSIIVIITLPARHRPAAQGFPAARATRALYHSGGSSMEAAVGWLEEHAEDANIDEPLLVPKVGVVCVCVCAWARWLQGRAWWPGHEGLTQGGSHAAWHAARSADPACPTLPPPLPLPLQSAPKKKLSPEEAKAAAADLIRRARERRERDEREAERLREQERIRWAGGWWRRCGDGHHSF